MKLARLAVLVAGAIAVAAFAGVFEPSGARSASPDLAAGGITVTGTGSISVTPDGGSMSFGTVSQSRTAAGALTAGSQAVARVIEALRGVGLAGKDLQTSEVSLSPRLNDKGDEIVGYTATNTVTASIRKLADLGRAIDAAVAAGANQVYGPGLLASDQDAAYRSALKAAVANARAKAETLASASGLTVGKVTAIVESGESSPQPLPMSGAARDAATPIEPGTQTIEAVVTVTFASD
jgi:uncharacterized protein YggE